MTARHEDEAPASRRPGLTVSGAEARVGEWARKYWEAMRRIATCVLEDRDAAEDVVQRAFMKALSKARRDPDEVAGVRKPQAWMVKITRNMASDVLKTDARRRLLRRENGDEIREILFPEPDAGSQRDPRAERVLEAAPKVLTTRQFEVFSLAWEGMKDEEVARELGMKRNTVRWHRMEAIRRLREYFGNGGGVSELVELGSAGGRGLPGLGPQQIGVFVPL